MKEKYRDDFDNFVEKYHLVSKPDNSRTLYYFSCFGYEGLLTLKELKAATIDFKNWLDFFVCKLLWNIVGYEFRFVL